MNYQEILTKNKYSIILRKNTLDEYAVVHGLNKETGSWNYTVAYYNFGQYSSVDQAKALSAAIECFRAKTEDNYIHRNRLEELATQFKDALLEDDKYSALVFFDDFCEMTESEKEWFGIDEEEI